MMTQLIVEGPENNQYAFEDLDAGTIFKYDGSYYQKMAVPCTVTYKSMGINVENIKPAPGNAINMVTAMLEDIPIDAACEAIRKVYLQEG